MAAVGTRSENLAARNTRAVWTTIWVNSGISRGWKMRLSCKSTFRCRIITMSRGNDRSSFSESTWQTKAQAVNLTTKVKRKSLPNPRINTLQWTFKTMEPSILQVARSHSNSIPATISQLLTWAAPESWTWTHFSLKRAVQHQRSSKVERVACLKCHCLKCNRWNCRWTIFWGETRHLNLMQRPPPV